MTGKYCSLSKSRCEFGTNKKADCENCRLNKRYTKRTVDNWESYIVDNITNEEYGADINPLLDLLNEQDNRIEQLDAEATAKSDEIYVLNERIQELETENVKLKQTIRDITPKQEEIIKLREIEKKFNDNEWEKYVNNGW